MLAKTVFASLVMAFSLSAYSAESAPANVYTCNGYTLEISETSVVLINPAAGSRATLAHAGMNSGTSTSVILAGAIIRLNTNILSQVLVRVDNELFQGAPKGNIRVAPVTAPNDSDTYTCRLN